MLCALARKKVYVTIKVFEGNFEITQRGGRVKCQLKTSKSRVCLDQNWVFVERGEEEDGGPIFRLFSLT